MYMYKAYKTIFVCSQENSICYSVGLYYFGYFQETVNLHVPAKPVDFQLTFIQ